MQTAVIGNADSEDPIELPMEAIDLDVFRHTHQSDTFWCGLWLGGCGSRLTTKLYVDRACHFAHVPHPGIPDSPCRRTSTRASGAGSADHLYIKAAALDWMAGQGIVGAALISRDETGVVRLGGEVVVEPTGHETMRFVLDESAVTEHAPAAGTILGPGIEHDPRALVEHGFVHRVRCVSNGVQRRVQIGTQHRDGTDWFDLDEVELTPEGLSTPAVAEIRRRRTQSVPIGVRAHDVAAKTAAAPAPPIGVQQAVEDRTAVFAALQEAVGDSRSLTRLQRCLDRAEAVSMQGATAAENELMRQAADVLLRLRRGVGASFAPQAQPPQPKRRYRDVPAPRAGSHTAAKNVRELLNTLEQHSKRTITAETEQLVERLARRAEAAGMLLSFPERDAVTAWKKRISHEAIRPGDPATAKTAPASPRTFEEKRAVAPIPSAVVAAADQAREILEEAARLGETLTWAELKQRVPEFAGLSPEKQRQALGQIDAPGHPTGTGHARAFLASLITADVGGPHPSYRRIAEQQGHFLPDSREKILAAWQSSVTAVHERYNTP
ncbi:hypothetical protein [Streptomyces sp. bgisy027]|uniref:hypothetical protein n=1 Tax=Streptomyces sp. bgisy027 TaxID=3413770 RepID=UPI003D718A55